MNVVTTCAELKSVLEPLHVKAGGKRVTLVPTMGALHAGHISLVKLAHMQGAPVVVSIFVNPTQFNDQNDYKLYPRNVEADCKLLEQVGVHTVFAPGVSEVIYAADHQSWVTNEALANLHEGASRPGHFRGVTTIVTKLFNLVQPGAAVFGEKDFQQLRIIETLVRDLNFPITIIRAPIAREEGGLAMSSRNERLSAQGRISARALSRGPFVARDAFKGGQREGAFLKSLVVDTISAEPGVALEYVAIVDEMTLLPINQITTTVRILIAAGIEGVRLIDNVELATR